MNSLLIFYLDIIYLLFRHIIQTEGMRSLFRGLGPNLVGVAPARYYLPTMYILYYYISDLIVVLAA